VDFTLYWAHWKGGCLSEGPFYWMPCISTWDFQAYIWIVFDRDRLNSITKLVKQGNYLFMLSSLRLNIITAMLNKTVLLCILFTVIRIHHIWLCIIRKWIFFFIFLNDFSYSIILTKIIIIFISWYPITYFNLWQERITKLEKKDIQCSLVVWRNV